MTDWSVIDRLLDEATGLVFPSAQVCVLDRLGTVYERATGEVTDRAFFDVASLTKPLCTVTLVMRRVERGELSLDEEVRPGVSVRRLLSHSSGLPAYKPLGATRSEIVEACRVEPLESEPGTRSVYSDLGFILLGDLLERRSGRRLDQLFADEVAGPLGVETAFGPRDPATSAPTEGELRGVVHDENARAMDGVAGHAGLFSTARDVAAIAGSLLGSWAGEKKATGRSVVFPATVRQFWTPAGVPDSTWCLGWDRPSATNSAIGARWPREGVGHFGFTGCSLWLDPPRGRAVALLSNRIYPTRDNERIKQLRPLLHDAVVEILGS